MERDIKINQTKVKVVLVKKSANKSSKCENNSTASRQSTKHLSRDNLTQNPNFGTVNIDTKIKY